MIINANLSIDQAKIYGVKLKNEDICCRKCVYVRANSYCKFDKEVTSPDSYCEGWRYYKKLKIKV